MSKKAVLICLAGFVVLSVACARESKIKKYSLAPGCIEYEGVAPLGGCFGKTVISDLKVDPKADCLTIGVNNCNGGILEVGNLCSDSLILGGVEIAPGEGYVALDMINKETGAHYLKRSPGNFSEYVPQQDEKVEISGTLGKRAIKIFFTKTKKLC